MNASNQTVNAEPAMFFAVLDKKYRDASIASRLVMDNVMQEVDSDRIFNLVCFVKDDKIRLMPRDFQEATQHIHSFTDHVKTVAPPTLQNAPYELLKLITSYITDIDAPENPVPEPVTEAKAAAK